MDALLNSCQRLSNVTIRCHDGLVSTHKIILASVSSFIKEILEDIPSGDQVTVMMPDFGSGPIEDFLTSWMKQMDVTVTARDIDRAFGKVLKLNKDGKENPSSKINMKNEVDEDDIDTESGSRNRNMEQGDRTDIYETDFYEIFMKEELKSIEKRTGKARKRERVFDVSLLPLIDEKIQILKQELIPLPLNYKDVKHNTRKEKGIALQKAFREVVSTGCSNRKAASMFGISEFMLRMLIKCPEEVEYKGRGRRTAQSELKELLNKVKACHTSSLSRSL